MRRFLPQYRAPLRFTLALLPVAAAAGYLVIRYQLALYDPATLAAMLAQLGVGQVMELTLEREPSQWFAIWFAPVCGLVSVVGLFICVTTSIRYSREKLVLRYPLRKKRELYWREIERVEMVPVKGQVRGWKTLRLYTQGRVYKLNLARLRRGRDGFMTELYQMAERYEIPCVEMKA